jgi:hypothetical protein
MYDKRLIGTWRSDKRRTAREIRARRDIPAGKRRTQLVSIFGKLTLRYTRSKCYTEFNGTKEVRPLRIVAKDSGGVVVLGTTPLSNQDLIYHIRFEAPSGPSDKPQYYWISLGQFREYFRRLRARRPTLIRPPSVK